ncbi:MAG: hypothetical protein AAF479_14485 [Pseudomonadota bacterium]
MLRRKRRPGTHLLRAGQRTNTFESDEGVPEVRFRAQVLQGQPSGRIDVEAGEPDAPVRRVLDLQVDNAIIEDRVRKISIVPDSDTAITFVTEQDKPSIFYPIIGAAFVLLATATTFWEFIGG